jgi:hypothetical protein
VYSFDISNGALAWTYSTGGYAYSAPTVASTVHSPPTVYIGSFDGNIYALNAKNGEVRWSRSTGGQVVGSLSAVGEIVYVAEFTHQTTTGYMMRSGRKVFSYPKGTYTPIISDGRNLYVTGYSSITKLAPIRPKPARVSNNFVAPKPRFPSHRLGKGIENAIVAPAVKPGRLTPGQRRRRAIRLRRRRAAAAAGAARRAQRQGTARREGGR